MSDKTIEIQVDPHPILRPVAFTTDFPSPLGELTTPPEIRELLSLDAAAPLQREEDVRLAVRDMLRHWGHKPAGRGKPASEYLVRAVDRGNLDLINPAVDVCNAVSLHCGIPIALVDLEKARPPFRVTPGLPEESYVFNASGQEMSLKGLICLRDAFGPCANPVKDAQRTKTHAGTVRTLTVLWGLVGHEDRVRAAVAWYRELLEGQEATTRDVGVTQDPGLAGAH